MMASCRHSYVREPPESLCRFRVSAPPYFVPRMPRVYFVDYAARYGHIGPSVVLCRSSTSYGRPAGTWDLHSAPWFSIKLDFIRSCLSFLPSPLSLCDLLALSTPVLSRGLDHKPWQKVDSFYSLCTFILIFLV